MASPRERLQKIIAAKTPSQVVYQPAVSTQPGQVLYLTAVKTVEGFATPITEDAALQDALAPQLREYFDRSNGKWIVETDLDRLWNYIRSYVIHEYNDVSQRCEATKRKTIKFIGNIGLNDTHLANYIIQTFLKARSDTYKSMKRLDKEPAYDAFEALRRTYGKRA